MAANLFSPSHALSSFSSISNHKSRDFAHSYHNQHQPYLRTTSTTTILKPQTAVKIAVSSSIQEISMSSELASNLAVHLHQNPSSLYIIAENVGYSVASYYTSLGLFVISVPGLWSLIKRSVKSKIVKKTFVQGDENKKAPNQLAGEILSFFTRNNFAVSDRGETITGAYYWKRATRKEQIKIKMIVGEDGTLSDVVVQGDDQQVEQMRKELQLNEKGMVYVKGILER